jgi:hypothetical protein
MVGNGNVYVNFRTDQAFLMKLLDPAELFGKFCGPKVRAYEGRGW